MSMPSRMSIVRRQQAFTAGVKQLFSEKPWLERWGLQDVDLLHRVALSDSNRIAPDTFPAVRASIRFHLVERKDARVLEGKS